MLFSSQGYCSLDCTGMVLVKPRWTGKNFFGCILVAQGQIRAYFNSQNVECVSFGQGMTSFWFEFSGIKRYWEFAEVLYQVFLVV